MQIRLHKKKKTVRVVPLEGIITPGASGPSGRLNLAATRSVLDKAFTNAEAVILEVNSPGGSPVQSEILHDYIRHLAKDTDTKVITTVEDVAASGGYWVALAGDEILVRNTSIVGSIGVISSGFGFSEIFDKLGVERRLFTAGGAKSRLDPFSELKQGDVDWLKGRMEGIHRIFEAHVRRRRSEQCGKEPEGVYDGEVYLGSEAIEKGLADGLISTVEELIDERFPGSQIEYLHTKRSVMQKLFGSISAGLADGISATVSERLARASVGL